MEVYDGIVKYPYGKKAFPNKYKPGKFTKSLVVVLKDTGEEVKIYGDVDQEPHASLQRGDAVEVEFKENKYGTLSKHLRAKVGRTNSAPTSGKPPSTPYPSRHTTPDEPQPANEFMDSMAKSYAYAFRSLRREFLNEGYEMPMELLTQLAMGVVVRAENKFLKGFVIEEEKPSFSETEDVVEDEEDEEYEDYQGSYDFDEF